ncbi:translation initiation factor IF-2-like isoform X1 [Grus americana]|uniref:translation initiation factor IF-2-like isoform X1 n=1 Tax=Grus americana TaxID=9117 RepID=UPI00240884AA|nr:translation initiation factor IF-2-like isoform X1 [Grus americana]
MSRDPRYYEPDPIKALRAADSAAPPPAPSPAGSRGAPGPGREAPGPAGGKAPAGLAPRHRASHGGRPPALAAVQVRAAPFGAPIHRGPAPQGQLCPHPDGHGHHQVSRGQRGRGAAEQPQAGGYHSHQVSAVHLLHLPPVPFASCFSHRCRWRQAVHHMLPGRGILGSPASTRVKPQLRSAQRTMAQCNHPAKLPLATENHPPSLGKKKTKPPCLCPGWAAATAAQ